MPHPEDADRAAEQLEEILGDDAKRYLKRCDGDRRFALWLYLVDYQFETLSIRAATAPSKFWRAAYQQGCPPRLAALMVWETGEGNRWKLLEHLDATPPSRPELS